MIQKFLLKFVVRKLFVFILMAIFFVLFFQNSFSQNINDYRSVASGNWSDPSVWQVYSPDHTWKFLGGIPDASANLITVGFTNTIALDYNTSFDELVINGTLTLNSGVSLNLNNGSLQDLTCAGTITGAGDINIPTGASAVFTGGTLTGPGAINVSTGSAFYLAGNVTLNRTVNNTGLCAWNTGSISGTGVFNNNGVFTNETAFGGSWSTGFINSGTFTKTTGNINFFTGSFQNTSTIELQSGGIIINPSGGATVNGTINISSGANIQFGNSTFTTFTVNAAISGSGNVIGFSSNVIFSNTGSYNITGITSALGGTMTFSPGMTLTNIGNITPAGGIINLPSGLTVGAYGPILRISGGGTFNSNTGKTFLFQKLFQVGTVSGSDSIVVSDSVSFSSGSVSGTAAITLKSGGMGVIFNNGITLDKTFINNGTVNWSQNSISGNGSIINNSIFNMISLANSCGPAFTNNGTLNKSSNFNSSFVGPFNNASTGIINITNLSLMPFSNNGSQNIAGTVNISAGASFQLGNTSTGTFNITGNISGAGNFYGHTTNINFLPGSVYNISGITGTYSGSINFNTGMTLTGLGTVNSSSGIINVQPGLNTFFIGTSLTLAGGAVINFNSGNT